MQSRLDFAVSCGCPLFVLKGEKMEREKLIETVEKSIEQKRIVLAQEKEEKVTICEVCGYANPQKTAICKMCSNYLEGVK